MSVLIADVSDPEWTRHLPAQPGLEGSRGEKSTGWDKLKRDEQVKMKTCAIKWG